MNALAVYHVLGRRAQQLQQRVHTYSNECPVSIALLGVVFSEVILPRTYQAYFFICRRYVWIHPVHARLTLREFYLLRNIDSDIDCLPKLEQCAQDGDYLIAVYKGLSQGAHTLTRELDVENKKDPQNPSYLSVFRLCQLAEALLRALVEL